MPTQSPMIKKTARVSDNTAATAAVAPPVKAAKLPPAVTTRAQSVTERLREAILSGHFGPDEKLQEVVLSEMLNVSRTPIRAALQGLAAEGMLEYEPNCGYNVRRLDTDELIAIFDIRGALEGLAARFAAERGLSAQAQQTYRIALADGDRILSKSPLEDADIAAFRDVNDRIHDTIINAAGNRMISDMLRISHNVPMPSHRNIQWDDYRWIVSHRDDSQHYRWILRSHDDHYRIFEAIMEGEAARAEQLMREHEYTVKMRLKQQLESASGNLSDASEALPEQFPS
ncbi:MAG TPA: GntR family transcriptional regulator [Herbaspirillum sp.]|nr:GntR family transcriptional regulator [Herbaspirillum sp.]